MGSHMKKAIFEEQTAKALKKWQKAARERKKLRKAGGQDVSSISGFMSGENTPSHGSSPIHLLHKYNINSNDIESALSSPRAYHSETELSSDDHEPRIVHNNPERNAEIHHGGFSFVKP
jgi:mlo protein